MTNDLRFEVVYPHPIDEVWNAIATSEALAEWLMPNDFRPEVGWTFTFVTQPQPGFDGIVSCRVLECRPPERLAFTWKGGELDTVVTFTLSRFGESTRVVLEHTGFEGERAVAVSHVLGSGWNKKLLRESLPRYLAGR